MRVLRAFTITFAFLSLAVFASGDPLVYISNTAQFGTVDLATGAFHQIGPDLAEGVEGLAPTSNGSLLTLAFSGNLDSINPATGVLTVIGSTGLSDCTTPSSPCGPNSGSTMATFGGRFYALDLQNMLYGVNATTGAATAIGQTGIPALPFIPLSTNPDGTINVYDEALFSANGRFYALFDAGTLNPDNGDITQVITPGLYLIDPATAATTRIATTDLGLGAALELNGQTYAFANAVGSIVTLNLTTGSTSPVGDFDPAAGIISSAVATPEPGSAGIVVLGLLVTGAAWRTAMRAAR